MPEQDIGRSTLEINCYVDEDCVDREVCPIRDIIRLSTPALGIDEVTALCKDRLLGKADQILKVSPEEMQGNVGIDDPVHAYACNQVKYGEPCTGVIFFFKEPPAPAN